MGAWDMGPFDNDGARDLLTELRAATADQFEPRLRTAMAAALECPECLENPEAQAATAAAVLVAARLGATLTEKNVREFLNANPFHVSDELRSRALLALQRVTTRGDNEWFELWEESGRLPIALERLAPYRSVLSGKDTAPA